MSSSWCSADNEQLSREAWADQHLGDRASLGLVGQQDELARAVLALGKPTVVVLLNGRPLSVNYLAENAPAIVEGWYLGQETGNAVADVLFGKANPGGKLPVSIARHVGQLPIFYNHKPTARRGYLFDTTKPLYPFGFGSSYTSFEISAPRVERVDDRYGAAGAGPGRRSQYRPPGAVTRSSSSRSRRRGVGHPAGAGAQAVREGDPETRRAADGDVRLAPRRSGAVGHADEAGRRARAASRSTPARTRSI